MGKTGNRRPARRSAGEPGAIKGLGQNFLIDEDVVSEIVKGSGAGPEDLVIEIGPGRGALTEALANTAGRVIAIELDERMIPGLRVRLFDKDNVEIIHADVLEIDINALIAGAREAGRPETVRIIGNLPYYITTPIIMKLLEENIEADSITVMVQKEVGERLIAEPGVRSAGAITYTVNYYCEARSICEVPRTAFEPQPKVDSMVIRLDRRREPPVKAEDADRMFRCIKAGFMMRRKTMANALTALPAYGKADIERALLNAGIDPARRAESLTMEEFARLSDELPEA